MWQENKGIEERMGQIINIKWNDCRTWEGPSMPFDVPPSIIGHTVGFLIKETDKDYFVAQDRFDKETHPDYFYRHCSVIPKCQVLSFRVWDEEEFFESKNQ